MSTYPVSNNSYINAKYVRTKDIFKHFSSDASSFWTLAARSIVSLEIQSWNGINPYPHTRQYSCIRHICFARATARKLELITTNLCGQCNLVPRVRVALSSGIGPVALGVSYMIPIIYRYIDSYSAVFLLVYRGTWLT